MEILTMKSLLIFAQTVFACLFLTAGSESVLAQQIRDRELQPAFDFSTIEMPVEIVSIRLNGKEIQPGEKIKGDDDWLQGVSFTVNNVSNKPISYVSLGLKFPRPEGFVVYILSYGIDVSRGTHGREVFAPAIQSGESRELKLTKENYPFFLSLLARGGASRSFTVAPYYVAKVFFENEFEVFWEGGFLKKRDPANFHNFKIVERYVLPKKK